MVRISRRVACGKISRACQVARIPRRVPGSKDLKESGKWQRSEHSECWVLVVIRCQTYKRRGFPVWRPVGYSIYSDIHIM